MMGNNIVALDVFAPVGSLDAYIQRVNQIPALSFAQEKELAIRLSENNDLQAARGLILPHLRFVVHVAKQYIGYGLPLGDLIQEGNIGLMKAVRRFDHKVGVRLVTFAVHWIKAEIHEYVLRNWRIVRVATTKAQRKLFFQLRSAKKRLGWFTQEEVNTVANDLGVSPAVVVEMENRMNLAHDIALENSTEDDEDTHALSAPIHTLGNTQDTPEKHLENQEEIDKEQRVRRMLDQLDDRSKYIIEQRYLADKKATLQDLADHYDVSAERIRQLENKAIKQLKNSLF